MQSIIDVGEYMVRCGAEVARAEDSIERMLVAYGFPEFRVNVFIIVSNIQVTAEAPDGRIITQIRRMIKSDVNFDRLDYLNDLCRKVCSEKFEPEEIQRRISEIMNRPEPRLRSLISGSALVTAGFCLFFGGSLRDAAAAAFMGVVIMLVEMIVERTESNSLVVNFIVSLIAGIVAILLVKAGLGVDKDTIMIAGIMILIPGIALTNAVRDMLAGEQATGLLRFTNALLVSAAIAGGFALAIILLGGAL